MAPTRFAAGPGLRRVAYGAFWLAAFVFSASSYTLSNDHFDRISRARQIARYGAMPFRDYLDPGYFMSTFSSAGVQLLLGDNLLGEMLLNCVFVATGATLVLILSRHISRSFAFGLVAALLALLSLPRAYDFDKVLFYPLGLVLCWRYIEASSAGRLAALSAGIVVAALYRYDTGVYLTVAALTAMAVVHAGQWSALARRAGLLMGGVLCLSLPVLVFLHYNGGVLNAADQILDYGRREGAGTRILTPPRFSSASLVIFEALPPVSRVVAVRWSPSVDDRAREAAEVRHGLLEGMPRGEPADRTWGYRIEDASPAIVRSLLEDPNVEDTSGIDRTAFALTSEPLWTRAQRAVPFLRLRILPGWWHRDNANTFLYYLLRILPLIALVVLGFALRSNGSISRAELAEVSSLAALCVMLNLFILRAPVGARVGGMIGPAAILAAWLAYRVWQVRGAAARRTLKSAAIAGLAMIVWSVGASADWRQRLTADLVDPARFGRFAGEMARSPSPPEILGDGDLAHMVGYLRECTAPSDRILITWFAPEVYFFAQRGFAAGLATAFAGHWTEPRFQARSLQLLQSESVPVVILQTGDDRFSRDYPLLASYLAMHYRSAETTDFSDERPSPAGGSFTVLVPKGRAPSSFHPTTSLPCFS